MEYVDHLRQYMGGLDNQQKTLGLGVAATALVGGYLAVRLTRPRKNLPPGPYWSLPLLGNILDIIPDSNVYCKKLQNQHGDIFSFKLLTQPVVVLNTSEDIREAFIRNGNVYVGRPQTNSMDIFTMGQKDIVLGQYGPVLKAQRKLLHEALRKYALTDEVTENIADAVKIVVDHINSQKEAFDPSVSINLLFYNIIAQMTFGQKFQIDDEFFVDMVRRIDELNEKLSLGLLSDIFPLLAYIPIMKGDRMLQSFVKDALYGWIGTAWKTHQETFDSTKKMTDFTYYLLATKKEVEESDDPGVVGQLTDEHFIQTLSDIFFAGTDTSRFTGTWFVAYMAAYPEIQTKVQQEVDYVIGRDRAVEMSDWRDLHFTYATLHEVMRVCPVGPQGLPRTVIKDTTLGGYDIPKGTWVMPNIYSVHHDPREWDNPEEFNPSRFLDDTGHFLTQPAWLPFSTGRRVCVGESFAKPELTAVCATLMQKLTFVTPPGETLKLDYRKIPFLCQAAPFKILAKARE